MLSLQAQDDGTIVMEHLESGETFSFDRQDLDEVIGTLAIFRMALEADEGDEDD